MSAPEQTELELEDIAGIGPVSAGKLRDVGIDSVEALAVQTANDLSDIINCSKETASTMIIQAMKINTFASRNILLPKKIVVRSAITSVNDRSSSDFALILLTVFGF